MSKHQTDNDAVGFGYKVSLRLESLQLIEKREINILECYAGEGKIWKEVNERVSKQLNITKIDKRKDLEGIYLKGDNRKYLKELDLSKYDIIDLDAYGVPFEQLSILFARKYKGIVHVTFIQSQFGSLPHKLLESLGYTKKMVQKCPTLFYKNGFVKICNYLKMNKIRIVFCLSLKSKNYFYFKST